ncbi:class I SAM-dependent methyltransferase [Actinoplanes flavus]|uniref:Class I SAM-dependent methyltransferase n=1 Tax=Actinoplanes flavus TaxID=2820290 RepID=A0ABS3UJ75_9ACTN|nr:class I SAM-dependent methyltransferase [Actinoplanes flavus]MBO3738823.1 class I SAM-dependent methyltransferase [Actinoplanes flavus]
MATDWIGWHRDYDDPGSELAQRLGVVRAHLTWALSEFDGEIRVISLCAGDGRDVLPVLARHPGPVRATLVELNPDLARRARETAHELGLTGIDVRTGDAGLAGTYLDAAPAHILTACGVFGNISEADVRRTIAALRSLSHPGGVVVWTRGRGDAGPDPSDDVRAFFDRDGFEEVAFTRPAGARFRVGVHRLIAAPQPVATLAGKRLFSFVR